MAIGMKQFNSCGSTYLKLQFITLAGQSLSDVTQRMKELIINKEINHWCGDRIPSKESYNNYYEVWMRTGHETIITLYLSSGTD